jgi:hypothetical protein
MALTDDLVAAGAAFPAPLTAKKDGSLHMEAVIAERKSFLAKKKLTYSCRLRVNEAARSVRFWEMLVEKGSGMSGGIDDMSPGFGFKKETYSTKGKERSGGIEEASTLFGKDYTYQWDYAAVRSSLRGVAEAQGYAFEVVLNPKSV